MANNFFGPQQREVGPTDAIKQWSQLPMLNNPQQLAQAAMLARGLGGLFQQQPSFEPIRNEYMRAYREKSLPGLLSNFTGNMQGSDYARAVQQGDIDLATRLAGLQANFQQHQFDKNREFSQNLLQQGMKPSHENLYAPVPYEAGEQYLKRQGIQNPTPEQVNKVLPQFQPPKTLMQSIPDYAKQARTGVQELGQAYQQGGVGGALGKAEEMAFGVPQEGAQIAKGGLTQEGQSYLEANPQVKQAVDKSLKGATPEQKEAANSVISKLADQNLDIFKEKLSPVDYQSLDTIANSPNEKVQQLLPLIRTKKELNKLRHYVKVGSKVRLHFFLHELLRRQKREQK